MSDAKNLESTHNPHPYDTINDTRFNKEGEDRSDLVFVIDTLEVSFDELAVLPVKITVFMTSYASIGFAPTMT